MAGPGKIIRPTTGNNAPRPVNSSEHRAPYRYIRPMGSPASRYITTRCYSPSGVQLWVADHGADVYALDVDANGYIYQSGSWFNSALGDSLFHKTADNNYPLVTRMTSSGGKSWCIKRNLGGSPLSRGICCSPSGHVYYGFNATTVGSSSDGVITKLVATTGAQVLTLPMAGFVYALKAPNLGSYLKSLTPRSIGRLRCNSSGQVFAGMNISLESPTTISHYANVPHRWISDAESLMYYSGPSSSLLDLNCDNSGNCFSGHSSNRSTVYTGILAAFDTTLSTNPTAPDNAATRTALVTGPYAGEFSTPPESSASAIGVSPSGLIYFKKSENDITQTVNQLTITGDEYAPTITTRATVAGLRVGVVGGVTPSDSLAVNDSGAFVYNIHPDTGDTHEMRAADGTVIRRADHGDFITCVAIRPNGTVIVAGKRVLAADHPE